MVFVLACLECAIDLGMVLIRRKTQLSVDTNLLVVRTVVSALAGFSCGSADMAYVMHVHVANAEGRNEALAFLLKYFKVAPKVIVYDFACALQDYCLNRQPEQFNDLLVPLKTSSKIRHAKAVFSMCGACLRANCAVVLRMNFSKVQGMLEYRDLHF